VVRRDLANARALARMTRRWLIVAWTWIGWTGLALFLGISSSLAYLAIGNPARWSLTIRMSLAEVYVWGALAPLVMRLARRFAFTRATLWRSLIVHGVAGLVVSAVKLIVDQVLRKLLFGFDGYVLITSLAPNLLFYWGIVAAAHGFAYYHSSRERELKASTLEARLAQARLQLLQMQLHPHFLFNTLHAISELVHEDPDTADRMIAGLSELLREALHASDVREVSLRRELDLLAHYLEIQRVRFGDRLRIEIDVDPRAMDALVPHLILQPVVENAIRHGIGARVVQGRVRIAARALGETLQLDVDDDGRGLDAAEATPGAGVGLGNTRERLQTLYDGEGRLTIEERSEGGTRVRLIVPLRVAPERKG
jgi:two-component system LytT family sensor kinase